MTFARLNVSETVINSVPKLCRQFDLQQYIWKKNRNVKTWCEKSTNGYFMAMYNININILYRYLLSINTIYIIVVSENIERYTSVAWKEKHINYQ